MVLYGAKTEYYGQKIIEDKHCKKCDNTTFLVTNMYTLPHIFFIPFMPVICKPLVMCTNCKKRYTLKRFSKLNDMDLAKQDINDIRDELRAQLPEETSAKYKRKNTIGTVFAVVAFSLIVVGMVAAVLG